MALPEVILKKGGGPPEVTVLIGQAQYGDYLVRLKDPKTGNRVIQSEGDNADDVSDTFRLKPTLNKLGQQVLSWNVIIAVASSGKISWKPTASSETPSFLVLLEQDDGVPLCQKRS